MMRKNRLLVLVIAIIGLSLMGCRDITTLTTTTLSTTSTTSNAITIALIVPQNLAIEGRTVSWNQVTGATHYVLKINETEVTVTENQYVLPNTVYGTVALSVKAVNSQQTTAYSAIINAVVTLKLPVPLNVRQEGNRILWDAVSLATGYVIKINGVEYLTLDTYYEWEASATTSVQVKAAGTLDNIIEASDYSSALSLIPSLSAPQNITQTNGVIQWDSVEFAGEYEIVIDEQLWTSSTNSINVAYQFVGSKIVAIKAKSAAMAYLDSSYNEVTLVFEVLTMPVVKNIVIVNGILTFDLVPFASGYELYSNGELIETINSVPYTIPLAIMNKPAATIEVKTLSTMHNASALSNPIDVLTELITTEAQLRALPETGSYVLGNDISLTSNWTALDFNGSFNGNGYTISNIVIASGSKNVGFFASLDGAVVFNLTLEGQINFNSTVLEANVGGLAGHAIESQISNVTVKMNINVASLNGVGVLGGFVGLLETTTIEDSNFEGDIVTNHFITGGFIGKAFNPSVEVLISRSGADGTIVVTGGEQSYSGGFIGFFVDNALTIRQCVASMDVTGSNYVGGFVGYMGNGHIEDSLSRGTISTHATNLVHMGGFVGRMEGYNNTVIRSIALTTVVVPLIGTNRSIGGFVGNTPGGSYATLYSNNLYNVTLSPIDRIGNPTTGRGDGITGRSTSQLNTSNSGFSEEIWIFGVSGPSLLWESQRGEE
jgi:hypothetical protein